MKTGTDSITANGASSPADDVRGQDDEIARDVSGEEAAKPEETDDVHTSCGQAEHRLVEIPQRVTA